MSVYYEEIGIQTRGEVDIVDITEDVQAVITKSKIKDGIACVFVKGSTGTVTTIEYEPGLMKDLRNSLFGQAPSGPLSETFLIEYFTTSLWTLKNPVKHPKRYVKILQNRQIRY